MGFGLSNAQWVEPPIRKFIARGMKKFKCSRLIHISYRIGSLNETKRKERKKKKKRKEKKRMILLHEKTLENNLSAKESFKKLLFFNFS